MASHLTSYFGVFPEEKSSGVDREGNPLSSGAMRMMNGGSSRSVTGTQVAVINDGVWIPFRRASSKKITDGTSKTYLVGEKAMDTLRCTTPRGTKESLHGRRLQETVKARLIETPSLGVRWSRLLRWLSRGSSYRYAAVVSCVRTKTCVFAKDSC